MNVRTANIIWLSLIIHFVFCPYLPALAEGEDVFYKQVMDSVSSSDVDRFRETVLTNFSIKNDESLKQDIRIVTIGLSYLVLGRNKLQKTQLETLFETASWSINQCLASSKKSKSLAEVLLPLIDKTASIAVEIHRPNEAIRLYESEMSLWQSFFPERDNAVFHERLSRLYREIGDTAKSQSEDLLVIDKLNQGGVVPSIKLEEPHWGNVIRSKTK